MLERGKKREIISIIGIIISYKYIDIRKYIKYYLLIDSIIILLSFNSNILYNNIEYITNIDRIFLLFINYISLIIFIYSDKYLNLDPYKFYFFFLLFSFLFILKSILSFNSFYSLFFFWELLGFFSFLLIKFWNYNLINNKFSFKALIWNRVGDIFFIYLLILFNTNSSFISSFLNNNSLFYFIFGIKSVQFLGLLWLLSAMVTPTPVSALLHSSSMVCIGWYLTYKMNINMDNNLLIYFLLFSLFLISFFDLKKLLALSTSFNLFLIFISNKYIGFIHMLNHGLFKSLLFLFSGFILHFHNDLRFLSLFFNPFLFKFFLFFFLPLPFIFISLSKDFIFLSSSFSLVIILLIYSFIYFSFTKLSYSYFLSFPSFNYYLSFLSSFSFFFSIPFFFFLSLSLPYYYPLGSFFFDLFPFFFLFSNFKFFFNLILHLEFLFISFFSSFFLLFFSFYYLLLEVGFFLFFLLSLYFF